MLKHAYFESTLREFVDISPDHILGRLARVHGFDVDLAQRDAWLGQIDILKRELSRFAEATLFLEFAIPRMGKRADAVLLLEGIVFVIEFKVGSTSFDRAGIDQVHDYSLDLKNFHLGSHDRLLIPILIATEAPEQSEHYLSLADDRVAEPLRVGGQGLGQAIAELLLQHSELRLDPATWLQSGYRPTPTIVEAAQALYRDHDVQEISRSDAGATNLSSTTDFINDVVKRAQQNNEHAICFVTGVPGAGKTLAGLNIATQRAEAEGQEAAVFLSGNGPLVDILREALARDQASRNAIRIGESRRRVASFVQNIHHFRDDAIRDESPPHEQIVIFDEAQRAWTRDQASRFMRDKRQVQDFDMSEPEFLISVMDRHKDWSVIVCLVGGGQEINTGEAGLSEWVEALQGSFPDWSVYVSHRLEDPDYIWTQQAREALERPQVTIAESLHLGVSLRSFRSEAVSEFIGHVLENRPEAARDLYETIQATYPIRITRDLGEARAWLKAHARGTERYGLVASSGGYRLRPEGINPRQKIDPPNWFLNSREDVRSAYALEEVATEFDIQGLELDWTCVCWDLDLRREQAWAAHKFVGTRWQRVGKEDRKLFLKNAYRVLLTRARQGMVIFVPKGDRSDATRPPGAYDGIADYLAQCGAVESDHGSRLEQD
ncbi:MAG: hypothetical protein DHS20C03_27020 [Minwuia thermotolerans]|nr:MAG: hypothetical protein DHS20C03_27020 [Minwuia thermotolerans]